MRFSRTTVFVWTFGLLTLVSVTAVAQDTQPAAPAPAPASTTQPAASQPGAPQALPPITGFLDLEFTTAYYKRGFLLEDKGMIFQPMLDVSWNAIQHQDGFLSDLGVSIGTRESIHSRDSLATRSPRAWLEGDIFPAIDAVFMKRFKLDTTYVDITSPNGGFPAIQEMDWQMTFLDDGLLGPVTVHPYALFVKEIRHSALYGPCGSYLEFGAEPAFPLIKSQTFPVRLSFPTRVGLSTNDYYVLPTPVGTTHDEFYGYAESGISAMMPMTFVPHDFGMVFLTTGVDFLFLDHNMQLLNNGHDDAVIGRVNLTWMF